MPAPPTVILLSKFDVAERQLNQAIRLFFGEGDPVSIHTLSESAAQILYDIRHRFGAQSKIRDADIIKPESKKEWLASLFSSRNFLKHANRDPDELHEFKEEFNHFSLLDSVNMYLTAKKEWTPETIVYVQWFAMTYPTMVRPQNQFSELMNRFRSQQQSSPAEYRALCCRVIRELRSANRAIHGVQVSAGLPE